MSGTLEKTLQKPVESQIESEHDKNIAQIQNDQNYTPSHEQNQNTYSQLKEEDKITKFFINESVKIQQVKDLPIPRQQERDPLEEQDPVEGQKLAPAINNQTNDNLDDEQIQKYTEQQNQNVINLQKAAQIQPINSQYNQNLEDKPEKVTQERPNQEEPDQERPHQEGFVQKQLESIHQNGQFPLEQKQINLPNINQDSGEADTVQNTQNELKQDENNYEFLQRGKRQQEQNSQDDEDQFGDFEEEVSPSGQATSQNVQLTSETPQQPKDNQKSNAQGLQPVDKVDSIQAAKNPPNEQKYEQVPIKIRQDDPIIKVLSLDEQLINFINNLPDYRAICQKAFVFTNN